MRWVEETTVDLVRITGFVPAGDGPSETRYVTEFRNGLVSYLREPLRVGSKVRVTVEEIS